MMSGVLAADIEQLFPPPIVTIETYDAFDQTALLPEESYAARQFSGKRIADFAAGRACARRALAEIGYADVAITIASDRRPAWPDGIVGSITHTNGFCAAAVAPATGILSLGIDAERVGRVVHDIWNSVFTPPEREFLSECADGERGMVATIVFSAKEAFYKCQFGITGAWLDFSDLNVTLDPSSERSGILEFSCIDSKRHPNMPRFGRYLVASDLVVTGTFVPA